MDFELVAQGGRTAARLEVLPVRRVTVVFIVKVSQQGGNVMTHNYEESDFDSTQPSTRQAVNSSPGENLARFCQTDDT